MKKVTKRTLTIEFGGFDDEILGPVCVIVFVLLLLMAFSGVLTPGAVISENECIFRNENACRIFLKH